MLLCVASLFLFMSQWLSLLQEEERGGVTDEQTDR